jgi:phosphatidylglycerol lysyltransferase
MRSIRYNSVMMTQQRFERLGVSAVAASAFLSGLAALFAPLAYRIPLHFGLLVTTFRPVLLHRALTLLLGFTLIYISYQLAQRKRTAWWIALGIAAYLVAATTLYHGAVIVVGLASLNLALLALCRRQFTARSSNSSLRQGITLTLLSLLVALVYGVAGFWLLDQRDFGQNFSLGSSIGRTIEEFTLVGNSDLHPHTRYARGFLDSLDFIGTISLGFGLYSLFRPLSYSLRVLPHERTEVQQLLERYGDLSEGHIKLWPADKSYFFTLNRGAAIAYRVDAGVALTAGAPVGNPETCRQAIEAFRAMCQYNGWEPAFMLVPEAGLELFEKDWRRLKIGEDAIIELNHFTAQVANNKHFRNIRNRFTKQGLGFTQHQPPHNPTLINELRVVSNAWQASGKKQWGFLQGRFDPVYLNAGPLYTVRAATGRVVAFANGATDYVPGQSTIDLMRHQPDAPKNTMDFLLLEILLATAASGQRRFNLGLATLDATAKATDPAPEERVTQLVARLNQDVMSVGGLRQFKNKFEPVWDGQYIVYRGLPTNLVRVGLALARATHINQLPPSGHE